MQKAWSNIQHPRGYAWHLCVTGNAPCKATSNLAMRLGQANPARLCVWLYRTLHSPSPA